MSFAATLSDCCSDFVLRCCCCCCWAHCACACASHHLPSRPHSRPHSLLCAAVLGVRTALHLREPLQWDGCAGRCARVEQDRCVPRVGLCCGLCLPSCQPLFDDCWRARSRRPGPSSAGRRLLGLLVDASWMRSCGAQDWGPCGPLTASAFPLPTQPRCPFRSAIASLLRSKWLNVFGVVVGDEISRCFCLWLMNCCNKL